tara:strand:- start:20593 stop:21633 length:1041 start_codon:yes stop_codon:yes gene_type:complete
MRCLTLAAALAARGYDCHFICRVFPGNLIDLISQRGFAVHSLPELVQAPTYRFASSPAHSEWLGVPWSVDARESGQIVNQIGPAWVVVDHYALDANWQRAVRKVSEHRLLVIDDLADRPHEADVLVDQNLGRAPSDYARFVPHDCRLLVGPQFALLRPEFSEFRPISLERRRSPEVRRVLITMGGVDKDNITAKVLTSLEKCTLSPDIQIEVVLGRVAPWLESVKEQVAKMSACVRVDVDVNDMARRMTEADFAIGAAGSTSWERCCLGLPTLTLILAENQKGVARALSSAGACKSLETVSLRNSLPDYWQAWTSPSELHNMSSCSAGLTDGAGVERLCRAIAVCE